MIYNQDFALIEVDDCDKPTLNMVSCETIEDLRRSDDLYEFYGNITPFYLSINNSFKISSVTQNSVISQVPMVIASEAAISIAASCTHIPSSFLESFNILSITDSSGEDLFYILCPKNLNYRIIGFFKKFKLSNFGEFYLTKNNFCLYFNKFSKIGA